MSKGKRRRGEMVVLEMVVGKELEETGGKHAEVGSRTSIVRESVRESDKRNRGEGRGKRDRSERTG